VWYYGTPTTQHTIDTLNCPTGYVGVGVFRGDAVSTPIFYAAPTDDTLTAWTLDYEWDPQFLGSATQNTFRLSCVKGVSTYTSPINPQ